MDNKIQKKEDTEIDWDDPENEAALYRVTDILLKIYYEDILHEELPNCISSPVSCH